MQLTKEVLALLIVIGEGVVAVLMLVCVRRFGTFHRDARTVIDQNVEIIQLLSRHPVTEDPRHAETDPTAL